MGRANRHSRTSSLFVRQIAMLARAQRLAPRLIFASGYPRQAISSRVRDLMQSVFAIKELRPGQEDIINAVTAGHDSLVVMPTGSGKRSVSYLAFSAECLLVHECTPITPVD